MKRNIKKFGLSFLTLLLFFSCTDNFLYNDKPPTEDGNYPSIIFKGEIIDNQFVHLFWKCNSTHIDGFIIERSVDGASFEQIARVRYPKAEFSDSLTRLPENVTKLSYQITTISMKYKLTCGVVNAVRRTFWEDTTFAQIVNDKVCDLYLTPENKTLVCVKKPAAVNIIQFPENEILFNYENSTFLNIFFSQNRSFFAILGSNNRIDLYENFSFNLLKSFYLSDFEIRYDFLVISPCGSLIAYYGKHKFGSNEVNKGLYIFNINEQKVVNNFYWDNFERGFGFFMPDSNYFIGVISGRLSVYKIDEGTVVFSSNYYADDITSIDYSPNHALLATGDRDGDIVLWDMQNFGLIREMHTIGTVHEMHFSPDGDVLVLRTRNYLELRGIPSGYKMWSSQAFSLELDWNETPRLMSFSPDGERMLIINQRVSKFYRKSDSFIWQIE
ncbi:hypothetical protein JW964_18920 [candidate division KSB1 bacterium]|nr:hypothetical protein [candidate division KSB1 bacterium]